MERGLKRCPVGYRLFHPSSASLSHSFLNMSSDASIVNIPSWFGFFSSESRSSSLFLMALRTNSLHFISECLRIRLYSFSSIDSVIFVTK